MLRKTIISIILTLSAIANLIAAPSGYGLAKSAPGITLLENYRRVVTPNNDGFNDQAFFFIDNPADLALAGKISDLRGRSVSEMRRVLSANGDALIWDGRDSSGNPVPQGIYLYKIRAGGNVITGTVLVAR